MSSRQDVLKRLWDTPGPRNLWKILESEPAARESGIAEELRREAEEVAQFNTSAAERLVSIAEEIERIRTSVERFGAIETVADLVELYRDRPFCHSTNFNRLLGVFWLDALQNGETARIENLRRAMKLLSDIYVAVNQIQSANKRDPTDWARTIQSSAILADPAFPHFLDERAHCAAKQGHPSAEAFSQMAAYIRLCGRLAPAVMQMEERLAGNNDNCGATQIRIPVSPNQAELWFLISREFGQLAARLADEVEAGIRSIESCMEEASGFEARHPSPSPFKTDDDQPTKETFFSSAFLEHLLLLKVTIIPQALEAYSRLLQTGRWNTTEKRAVFALHYTKAVLGNWRHIDNPLPLLVDSADLIKDTLATVVQEKSPRLMRDLWFTRGRLLENVGFWEPNAYPEAIDAYEQGLSIEKVKHESEARGRALTDYANTMSRLRTADEAENDEKIMATYQEALTTFGMEASTMGKTLALNSFAIFLNHRLHGERAANQERALSLIQEAIELFERDEKAHRGNELVARTLAGVYLTRSNVLHHREIGDKYELIRAAIDSLRTALDRLGQATDYQLRGIINLNLGHLNLELHSIKEDKSYARNGMYAYQEAERLLRPFPQEYSQALLGSAMLVSEIEDHGTPEGIEESIKSAEQALWLLEGTEDLQARARAHVCFAELHSLRGRDGDFEIAVNSYKRALADFLDSGHYQNAITAARQVAALWIERFTRDGVSNNAREAEQVLSRATEWIERIWSQVDSVEWRFAVSDRFSNVYAEIAWCQSVCGVSADVIAFSLARSKGREFLTHSAELRRSMQTDGGLGEFMDQLRVEARRAEHSRRRAAQNTRPDLDLSEATQESQERLRNIELRRRLLFPPPLPEIEGSPLGTVQAFLDLHPKAVIFDMTICRWGTVVLIAGGSEAGAFAGSAVRVLPLKESAAATWVSDWSLRYIEYLKARGAERDGARLVWAEQTDSLLGELSTNLIQPGLGASPDPDLELIIVAGRLAGLPLHAAKLADGRFVMESFASVTYCPNISVLSSERHPRQKPKSALFVVSDREGDLLSAARECQLAADQIASEGATVTVIAQIGNAVGRAALAKRGVGFNADVEVLEQAPTPRLLAELLPRYDHFFYSGHGVGHADQSGLIVVSEDGEPTVLAEHDILSMHALRARPIVVLSACETATGGHGSAELFDIASSFLRVGARFAVGSLWVVIEDCATAFTAEFYEGLTSDLPLSEAFGAAVRATKQHRMGRTTDRAVPADHPIYWAPFMALRGE